MAKSGRDRVHEEVKKRKVICPKCGREAVVIPCFVCKVLRRPTQAPNRPPASQSKCPYCGGRGWIIYCKWCDRDKRLYQRARWKQRQEALRRDPFLPYYDDRF